MTPSDQEQPFARITLSVPGFRIIRPIGAGGFATVYEAIQEDVDAPVALKVLAVDPTDAGLRERFTRECRTLGRLRSQQGVVPVYQAAFTTDGRPVIVMEYMPGGTLLDRLTREGVLPAADVANIGVTVARALDAAHKLGVYHRDIKPENILLDGDGQPRLADLGIATIDDTAAGELTEASLTPPHAPPERFLAAGSEDRVAGDVYSLASTLYQLLAGHPPFGTTAEGGMAALVDRVLNAPPQAISRSDVPASLIEALTQALAKDPQVRPATAGGFADALDSTLATTTSPVGTNDSTQLRGADLAVPLSTPVASAQEPADDVIPENTPGNPTVLRARSDSAELPVAAPKRHLNPKVAISVGAAFMLSVAGLGIGWTLFKSDPDSRAQRDIGTVPTTQDTGTPADPTTSVPTTTPPTTTPPTTPASTAMEGPPPPTTPPFEYFWTSNPRWIGKDAIFLAQTDYNRVMRWNLLGASETNVVANNVSGPPPSQLSGPRSVALDGDGNLYIADTNNDRIVKWFRRDNYATTVAGGNGKGFALNQLNAPSGVAVDESGNLYVGDTGNSRVMMFRAGSTTGIDVPPPESSTAAAIKLSSPTGVAVDTSGNVYVAESGMNRVLRWTPGTTSWTRVAGSNVAGRGSAELNFPIALAVDQAGVIYIADYRNGRVQRWVPGETAGTTVAGANAAGRGPGQLGTPFGVSVDADGNVYVASDFEGCFWLSRWAPQAMTSETILSWKAC